MSKTTSRWGLPYPEGTDAADVPKWIKELATPLDSVAMDDQGILSSRPTSTEGSPGKKGRYYYATDAQALYRDTGTSWVRVDARKTGLVKASGEVSNKGSITDITGASVTLEVGVKSLILVRANFQFKAFFNRESGAYKNKYAGGDVYIDGTASSQIFHEITNEHTTPENGDKASSVAILPLTFSKEVEAGSRVVKLRFIGEGSVLQTSTGFEYEVRPV